MARKYKKPPVKEAICAFKFKSNQQWDLTIPGLFFQRIQETFPNIEQTTVVQIAVDLAGNQVGQQVQPGVKFTSRDGNEVIQIAPDQLYVHQVNQYSSWDNFKPRILDMLRTYQDVAKIEQPDCLGRVSLRYLNRIELPPGVHELDDYFRVMPQAPPPIPQVFQTFLAQIQIPYGPTLPEQPERWLKLAFGSAAPEKPEHFAFILDLEMFTPDARVPDIDQVPNWLEIAHNDIEAAFEASFKNKTHKEIFEEVSE